MTGFNAMAATTKIDIVNVLGGTRKHAGIKVNFITTQTYGPMSGTDIKYGSHRVPGLK